jgi:hypothetical protein
MSSLPSVLTRVLMLLITALAGEPAFSSAFAGNAALVGHAAIKLGFSREATISAICRVTH